MTWDKAAIKQVLEKAAVNGDNSKFVFRALQALYQRQTDDEKEIQDTCHANGMGFNGRDAKFLSDVATKSKQHNGLTKGQTIAVAKSLKKYAGQLANIANQS